LSRREKLARARGGEGNAAAPPQTAVKTKFSRMDSELPDETDEDTTSGPPPESDDEPGLVADSDYESDTDERGIGDIESLSDDAPGMTSDSDYETDEEASPAPLRKVTPRAPPSVINLACGSRGRKILLIPAPSTNTSRPITLFVGQACLSDSLAIRCNADTSILSILTAIGAHFGEEVAVYTSMGKQLTDDRSLNDLDIHDCSQLRISIKLRGGGPKRAKAADFFGGDEEYSPEQEDSAQDDSDAEPVSPSPKNTPTDASYGCGVPWCPNRVTGLTKKEFARHLKSHLPQVVPKDKINTANLTNCTVCRGLGKAASLEKHSIQGCPQTRMTQRRKEDASRLRAPPSGHNSGEGGDDPVIHDEFEASLIAEDYDNTPLSKSGRDAPVTEVHPHCLPTLQELATVVLNGVAKAMETGDEQHTARYVAALFDLPVLLRNREIGDTGASEAQNTLSRLLYSPATIPDIVLTAEQRRCARVLKKASVGSGGRGNGHLAQEGNGRAKALRRAEELVCNGKYSAAVGCLESFLNEKDGPTPTMSKEETISELRKLHPDADSRDALPTSVLPKGLVLSHYAVQQAIDGAPKGSAAAMSGWTFDLMAQMADDSDSGKAFVLALTAVYNLILNEQGGTADTWIRARVVPIPKPQGGVRPIAVGEVLFRLMNRAVSAELGAKVGKTMQPLQWGVGVSGGAEIVSHAVQTAHDTILADLVTERGKVLEEEDDGLNAVPSSNYDPLVIWSTDIINAFNELRRSAAFEALLVSEEGKALARLFRWSYGVSAKLYLSDGTIACISSTGMRQGDPLGPLFFSLGYSHSVLRTIAAKFHRVTFLAYIDDTYFICRRSEGRKILRMLGDLMDKVGLKLSLGDTGKVQCLDPSPGAKIGRQGSGYAVVSDGIKVLGGPVAFGLTNGCGSDDFRSKFLTKELESCTKVVNILHELRPRAAYFALAHCVNARVSYLCRITPPWAIAMFLSEFDDRVDACLANIMRLEGRLPAIARTMRGLPSKLGGGCIRRTRDVSTCAFSASYLHAIEWIRVSCQTLWGQVWSSSLNTIAPQCGVLCRTIPYFVGISEAGTVWARPSTDDEIRAIRAAEENHAPVPAQVPRRQFANGAKIDSHLEAMIITKTLLAREWTGEFDEGICKLKDAEAMRAGFANSGDYEAYIAIQDNDDMLLEDYKEFRRDPTHADRASKRGQKLKALYGQARQGDWLVTTMEPVRWRQSGLQALRDVCIFAGVMRMVPGDSPLRPQFLSNCRVGGAAAIMGAYAGPGDPFGEDGLFIEALKSHLGVPMVLGAPGRIMQCNCGERVRAVVDDHHYTSCSFTREREYERHNVIADHLKLALSKTWGQAIKFSESRMIRRADGQASGRYADLVFWLNGNEKWIDVSCIGVASKEGKCNGSMTAGGKAATAREVSKVKDYAQIAGTERTKRCFVAFVVEVPTGRLGNIAMGFVNQFILRGPSFRRYKKGHPRRPCSILYGKITTTCALYNAIQMRNYRHNINETTDTSASGLPDPPERGTVVPYTRSRNYRESECGRTAREIIGRSGNPLDKAALTVLLPSKCEAEHCPNRARESALHDRRCECGTCLCYPCSLAHIMWCRKAAPRAALSGNAATSCSVKDCLMKPTFEPFRNCRCDDALFICRPHWKEHREACNTWLCQEDSCEGRGFRRCPCGLGHCNEHYVGHNHECANAGGPRQFRTDTACCAPDCSHDGITTSMWVCPHCNLWVCELHKGHRNSCRGPLSAPQQNHANPDLDCPSEGDGGEDRGGGDDEWSGDSGGGGGNGGVGEEVFGDGTDGHSDTRSSTEKPEEGAMPPPPAASKTAS
jgi:hypothetical protein